MGCIPTNEYNDRKLMDLWSRLLLSSQNPCLNAMTIYVNQRSSASSPSTCEVASAAAQQLLTSKDFRPLTATSNMDNLSSKQMTCRSHYDPLSSKNKVILKTTSVQDIQHLQNRYSQIKPKKAYCWTRPRSYVVLHCKNTEMLRLLSLLCSQVISLVSIKQLSVRDHV